MSIWAGEWHSKNYLDECRHLLYENCLPVLFRTRQECRDYINRGYGYIRDRKDLRDEPHGWRIPRAIKVNVVPAPSGGNQK